MSLESKHPREMEAALDPFEKAVLAVWWSWATIIENRSVLPPPLPPASPPSPVTVSDAV